MAGSVSNWIEAYRSGDQAAANLIWRRYYELLVRAAKSKLGLRYLHDSDEEDIAAYAFERFFNGLGEDRFPNLFDRDDLWKILLHITALRVQELIRSDRRLKRSLAVPRHASELPTELDEIIGNDPTPDVVVASAESLRDLLECLSEGVLQQTAVFKLEGLSNPQIARRLGCSLATVERKLKRIRHEWSRRADL